MDLKQTKDFLAEVRKSNADFEKKAGTLLRGMQQNAVRASALARSIDSDLKKFSAKTAAKIDSAVIDFIAKD